MRYGWVHAMNVRQRWLRAPATTELHPPDTPGGFVQDRAHRAPQNRQERRSDVLLDPAAQLGISGLPLGESGGEVTPRLGEVAPVVQPSELA